MSTRSAIAEVLKTTETNVDVRLVALKIAPVCGRCGGSGSYSFNQTDGDRCYGCNGKGHVKPVERDLPAMLDAAREAAEDGRLATYLRALDARKVVKNASDRAMAAWTATKVASVNSAIGHMVRSEELDGLAELRAANKIMCDAYQRANDAAVKIDPRSATYHADVIEAAAVVDAAIEEIKNAEYDVPAHLVAEAEQRAAKRAEAHKARFGY